MSTREVIEGLPENIREMIEAYRADYHAAKAELNAHKRYIETGIARAEVWGYIKGLRDAGVISEQSRKVLTVYVTI